MDTMQPPSDDPDHEEPSAREDRPTVVCIGASAGGLAALQELFAHIPAESGLSWVVIVHLSPGHESHLAELLQPHSPIPVAQVGETTELLPDHAYVIPPNANLEAVDTHLRPSDLEQRREDRAPIDHFLHTLAGRAHGESVCVILTGTGSDGTLGLKAIKEKGGLAIVQDPAEALHGGMPQSAISTGLVDLVLPLADIPTAIVRYAGTEPRIPRLREDDDDLDGDGERTLGKIFTHLRARAGRDYSRYKRSTVLRRVARRMQLSNIEGVDEYLALLRERPDEVAALADDLLITVTGFFRDPEVFEALAEKVIPGIFDERSEAEEVRVWSVGCATGEEAYSLTMLLVEEAERRERPPRIQVFASDLHEYSLARAREGLYPGDIEAVVDPGRLERFFRKEDGSYRVVNEIRERVIFAPHNLLSDPPFSRLDLLVCRNLMIYLRADVQADVVELFHYALRPAGVLVLGTSEHVDTEGLFRAEDKHLRIFRKRNVPAREPRLPVFPLARPEPGGGTAPPPRESGVVGYREMHRRIMDLYARPSLLIGPDDRVVHVSGRGGQYLVPPDGELTTSVYRLVRDELRVELRTIVHEARAKGGTRSTGPLFVSAEGETAPVVLHAQTAPEADYAGFVVVVFEEQAHPAPPASEISEGDADGTSSPSLARLREQRDRALQRLNATIDQYEANREEMRASNEELQSANEELRSTLEELETSKEELQSMNEELQAVGQENRHKVEELAQLSADLQNLLAATDIATIFLDRELRILRFTPRIGELFNVRATDRGRPLTHFTHYLADSGILDAAKTVLRTLVPVEHEVEAEDGRWYLVRMLPYRSVDDRIEGVVITFIDITERRHAEAQVRDARAFAENIVETLHEPLLVLDRDLRVRSANAAFYDGFDVEPDATLDHPVYELGNGQWDIPELRRLLDTLLAGGDPVRDYEVAHTFEQIGPRVMLLNARRLEPAGLILLGVRDVTDRDEALGALRESEDRFRTVANLVPDLLWRSDSEGRVTWVSERWTDYSGVDGESLSGSRWIDTVHPEERSGVAEELRRAAEGGRSLEMECRLRSREGRYRWFLVRGEPIRDDDGRVRHYLGAATDIHERRRAEEVRDEMIRRVVTAEEEERRRLSLELHDQMGQLITGLTLGIKALEDQVDSPTLRPRLEEIRRLAERIGHEAHDVALALQPPALDRLGLRAALEGYLEAWCLRHEMDCDFQTVGLEEQRFSSLVETTLYRVLQEGLTNVVRHAGARRVSLLLEYRDGHLALILEDDGRGFDAAAALEQDAGSKRLGLLGMRQRLALLDGSLEIDSTLGEGTTLIARVPAPAGETRPAD